MVLCLKLAWGLVLGKNILKDAQKLAFNVSVFKVLFTMELFVYGYQVAIQF